MSEVETHEHEFEGSPEKGRVGMCIDRNCTAVRVGTGRKWREPTGSEQLSITARMMEDIAIADAMIIIHGKERGMKRAREVLGYTKGSK